MSVEGPWHIDNFLLLMQEVGDDEVFPVDLSDIDWKEYCIEYARGIKKWIMPPAPVKDVKKSRKLMSTYKKSNKSEGVDVAVDSGRKEEVSPVVTPHTPRIVE